MDLFKANQPQFSRVNQKMTMYMNSVLIGMKMTVV